MKRNGSTKWDKTNIICVKLFIWNIIFSFPLLNDSTSRDRLFQHRCAFKANHLPTGSSVADKLQRIQQLSIQRAKYDAAAPAWKHAKQTWSGVNSWNPNFSVHIDIASTAAGSTKLLTPKNESNFSMQENSSWKYPCKHSNIFQKIHF